jgi:hypothetical protein
MSRITRPQNHQPASTTVTGIVVPSKLLGNFAWSPDGHQAPANRHLMRSLYSFWVHQAAVFLTGPLACAANAQDTMTFNGTIDLVDDPGGIFNGIPGRC